MKSYDTWSYESPVDGYVIEQIDTLTNYIDGKLSDQECAEWLDVHPHLAEQVQAEQRMHHLLVDLAGEPPALPIGFEQRLRERLVRHTTARHLLNFSLGGLGMLVVDLWNNIMHGSERQR